MAPHRKEVVVLAVAVSMLLVPATAMAGHNSVGMDIEITRADEVVDGELQPDLPPDSEVYQYSNIYHSTTLGDEPVPNRTGPVDQRGDHYTDCKKYSEFDAPDDPQLTQRDVYEDALPNTDGDAGDPVENACWVGLLDSQAEYVFAGNIPGFDLTGHNVPAGHEKTDPLYFLNPCDSEDWQGCEEDDPDCDRANPDHMQADACQNNGHDSYWPGQDKMLAIDMDLVEAAIGGNGEDHETGVDGMLPTDGAEVTNSPEGSTTWTLPLEATFQLFVFGYPHPDNPDPNPLKSDSQVFSQPARGVPDDACGAHDPDAEPPVDERRTPDCQLLTPKDLELYDTNVADNPELGDSDKGRLCVYMPQYVTIGSEGLAGGPCGVFGTQVLQFFPETAGGFGTETVSTYQSTIPGFHEEGLTVTTQAQQAGIDLALKFGTDNTTGHQDQFYGTATLEALMRVAAINPEVPYVDHDSWCVRPQILTDGETVGDDPSVAADDPIADVPAPGFYGTYQADAIDNDAYPTGLRGAAYMLHDGDERVPMYDGWHEETDEVLQPADAAVGDAFGTAGDLAELVTDAVPDNPFQDEIDDLTATAGDANDLVGPTESSDPEPMAELERPNYEEFEKTVDPGLSCTGLGVPQFAEEEITELGALRYDAQIVRQVASIKDPTVFNESAGLPARASDTTDGTWHADVLTFQGPTQAFVDSNRDGEFSGCAPNNGQPSPNDDNCVWGGLWDAYNPACSAEDGSDCGPKLADRGYDVGGDLTPEEPGPSGVGMVATLELSGTTLILEDPTGGPTDPAPAVNAAVDARLVNQDAAERTCVIMTSVGFEDELATHMGTDGVDDTAFDDEDRDALCPPGDYDEVVEFHDAFQDQNAGGGLPSLVAPVGEGFDSRISWIPITPTPDAAQDQLDVEDDRLCVTGVYSTKESVLAEQTADDDEPGVDGTGTNIQQGADHTETYYRDCDVLTSEHTADPSGPDDGTPEDGTWHTWGAWT